MSDPTDTWLEDLGEILEDAYRSGWLDCKEGGDYYGKTAPNNNKELAEHTKQLILTKMMEVIGGDETDYPSLNLDKTPHEDAVIRNKLRSEQRKALGGQDGQS